MDVEALKEFREKLVHARKVARGKNFDQWITTPCGSSYLRGDNADVDWNGLEPADLLDWYWYASPSERAAMWDNSIAAIDAQISLGRENNS